mmetsp:Transcript_18310/g.38318  ORF Transcript_18310/g.38318 Transcript_18310/m.38318 type:complete len:321 (+) Transcript_18310:916-1878(+)
MGRPAGIGLDPIVGLGDAGVDTREGCFGASDAPGDDADLDVLGSVGGVSAEDEGSSAVSLAGILAVISGTEHIVGNIIFIGLFPTSNSAFTFPTNIIVHDRHLNMLQRITQLLPTIRRIHIPPPHRRDLLPHLRHAPIPIQTHKLGIRTLHLPIQKHQHEIIVRQPIIVILVHLLLDHRSRLPATRFEVMPPHDDLIPPRAGRAVGGRQDDVRGDEGAAAEEADGVVEGDGVGVAGGGGFGAADDAGGFEEGLGGGIGFLAGSSDGRGGGGGEGAVQGEEGEGNGGDGFHFWMVVELVEMDRRLWFGLEPTKWKIIKKLD